MNPGSLFDFTAPVWRDKHATAGTIRRQCRKMASVLLLLVGCMLTGCYTNTSDLTATPNPLDFGSLRLDQFKDLTLNVTFGVSNFGGNVTGSSIAVDGGANPGDFQIVSQTCIGNTGMRNAVIRFKPTAVGPRSATLTIIGTIPVGQATATYRRTVTLLGNSIAPLSAALAGAALQFDGTSSRVTVPHNNALNAFPFTAEAWVNTNQTGGDAVIVSKYASGSSAGWYMSLHNGSLTAAYIRDGNNYVWDGGAFTFTGGNVADGQWHHVAFVVDRVGGRLYLDGVLQNTLAWYGTPGSCSATQNVTLGAFSDGSSSLYGQMDEIRLWNTARTSAQIQINQRATQKENEPDLLAYYRLDEGKGTAIADATANHFNGTLSSSATWLNSLAPVDAVIVAPGQSRAFKVAGFDIDGKALTFTPASYPVYGRLSVSSPAMMYAPGANFTSSDLLTYTASNGASVSSAATVRLLYRTAGANTLTVPAQYPTIQAAINAAGTGDTILVANGTYTGAGNISVDFRGKGLLLKSKGGYAACIIDCQQRGRAFFLSGGETSASRIEGFTIQNGHPDDYYGGGIYVRNSNPTVANCLFLNNIIEKLTVFQADPTFTYYDGYGGGMYGGTAVNCTFTGNRADTIGGGMCYGTAINCAFTNNSGLGQSGGGMYGGTATNCAFTGNSSRTGGGMYGGTATNCIFTRNRADSGGGMYGAAVNCAFMNNTSDRGGGMYGGTATNCVFMGNSASEGGGLYGVVSLVNCTVIGNSASNGGGADYYSAMNTLTNCIIWGNTANNGPQIYLDPTNSVTANVKNSDVQGGWPGVGNINADPLFVNAAGNDFHLLPNSPCIDAGTTVGITLPATDLGGNLRILGNAPDMGAYEFLSRRCSGKIVFQGIVPNAAPQSVRFQLRPLNGGTPLELTALVPASGEFSFGLPSQSYTLWIKSDRYLAVSVPLPDTGGDVSGLAPLLYAGDANNDNSVDVFDFALLSQSYFLSAGDAGYDARADFNGDGTVDIFDYVLLVQNYFLDGAP